jgi:hypothetical protein
MRPPCRSSGERGQCMSVSVQSREPRVQLLCCCVQSLRCFRPSSSRPTRINPRLGLHHPRHAFLFRETTSQPGRRVRLLGIRSCSYGSQSMRRVGPQRSRRTHGGGWTEAEKRAPASPTSVGAINLMLHALSAPSSLTRAKKRTRQSAHDPRTLVKTRKAPDATMC